MRHNLFLGVAAVALIAPAGAMAQQTTSVIRGTVTSNGAPVAGAQVTATETASGTVSRTTTDVNGGFSLVGLRPGGTFTVAVEAREGSTEVSDIHTVVGQPYTLPIELADAGGDIVVTAGAIAGAGVTSDGPQTVLTARDISKVASVNRNVRDLARRDPFATLDWSNGQGAVSFAGVNPRFNRFTINGVQVNDSFGLNPDANPTNRGPIPFDAIGQFSVSIAPYDIRQGNFIGGAMDTQMKSGTNTFTGTGFYSQSTDGLQGSRIGSNRVTLPDYNSETYGATLSGPIIKDKLFFMVSAERNTDPRPLSVASLDQIPGYNAERLQRVIDIANTARYGNYDTGEFVTVNDQKDEKIVGKIDWNVTDGHRFSLSYINAYEESTIANGTSANANTPVIGLASNYYQRSNLLRAGIAQLNSDWTDRLSTEARFLYRSIEVGQNSLMGTGYPQIRVCTDLESIINENSNSASGCGTGVPIVAFGPDNSRQANELFFDTWGGSLLTRYSAGNHDIKLLVEYNENRSRNLFVQNASGSIYFDSIADFEAGRASAYNLQVAVNGDLESAAADFKYGQYTFGFQDDWAITDRFTLSYGARYDLYGMRSQVPLNTFYLQRYNFPNTKTYKGLDNFQPRISFDWRANDWLKLRGGVGVFGGGSPDVYLSNSFSTTGVVTNALNSSTSGFGVIRANSGTGCSATPQLCGILDNMTAPGIPQAAVDYLTNNTDSLALAPTSSLAQDIHLPSVMKATFSADATLFGINFGGDFLYTKTRHAPTFTDLRSVRIGTLPDGRPRYQALTVVNGTVRNDTNADYLFYDDTRGRSYIGVVRADKTFDFGLMLHGSYTWQDVKDVSPATSSTASSLYGNAAMVDPNVPAYGTSSDQIKWAFKYGVGFDHAFFGDYRTVIQLFGETRAGRPFSYTMRDNNGGRSPVFGTLANNDRYLLYVPASTTDPLVSYDSDATAQALDGLINSTKLRDYRGRISAKNISRNRAFTRIDLHLEQEIPTFLGRSRISIFGDIENLPNLLNSDWGGLRQLGFPYTAATVDVQCLTAATPTGTGPTAINPATGQPYAAVNTAPTQTCAQYRYSNFRAPNTAQVNVNNSLYLIRIGARFTF